MSVAMGTTPLSRGALLEGMLLDFNDPFTSLSPPT